MGIFSYLNDDQIVSVYLPEASQTAVGDVLWGLPEELFSPAYWWAQYLVRGGLVPGRTHRLGKTFEEEVVACVLGGYGIPAEVGLAAFETLRQTNLICSSTSRLEIEYVLREPMMVRGHAVRYRFWAQKAKYLSMILDRLPSIDVATHSPQTLRASLMEMPGIGPKTASWIVRNWLGAHDVAILDIHVIRAGRLMRLFSDSDKVENNYLSMEARFLELAHVINVPAGDLDALMWSLMRETPTLVSRLLGESKHSSNNQQDHRAAQHQLQLA